jgi:hypothetical protein
MSAAAGSARPDAYAREIEREWSRMLDRPVVLSPKDWVLISDWHARSIPLSLILESMRHTMERPGRRSPPRNLGFVSAAVEEAWQVVLDGRRGTPIPETPTPLVDPVDAWCNRRDAERAGSALRSLLSRLLNSLEEGQKPQTVDRSLDESLETAVSDDLLGATRSEIDAELAPFADRMDDETLDRTRRTAILDRLRRALNLPILDRTLHGGRPEPPC